MAGETFLACARDWVAPGHLLQTALTARALVAVEQAAFGLLVTSSRRQTHLPLNLNEIKINTNID